MGPVSFSSVGTNGGGGGGGGGSLDGQDSPLHTSMKRVLFVGNIPDHIPTPAISELIWNTLGDDYIIPLITRPFGKRHAFVLLHTTRDLYRLVNKSRDCGLYLTHAATSLPLSPIVNDNEGGGGRWPSSSGFSSSPPPSSSPSSSLPSAPPLPKSSSSSSAIPAFHAVVLQPAKQSPVDLDVCEAMRLVITAIPIQHGVVIPAVRLAHAMRRLLLPPLFGAIHVETTQCYSVDGSSSRGAAVVVNTSSFRNACVIKTMWNNTFIHIPMTPPTVHRPNPLQFGYRLSVTFAIRSTVPHRHITRPIQPPIRFRHLYDNIIADADKRGEEGSRTLQSPPSSSLSSLASSSYSSSSSSSSYSSYSSSSFDDGDELLSSLMTTPRQEDAPTPEA
ncbi:MAG: hypothetical protein WC763_06670 [Candidatus Paceibacterota bacterium]